MALLDVFRLAPAIAHKILKTGRVECTVMYERYLGGDEFGTKTFAAAVPLDAVVDWKQKQLRTQQGVLSVSRASILLLNVAQVIEATNGEGIDDGDRFTLPDGDTGPILDMGGFIDPETHIPLVTEIFLG